MVPKMKIERFLTNDQILKEVGRRIARHRLQQNLSQKVFADEIGISRSGLQRLENGDPGIRLVALLGALRVLGSIHALDALLQDVSPTPLEMADMLGKNVAKPRKRASGRTTRLVARRMWGDGTPMGRPSSSPPEG